MPSGRRVPPPLHDLESEVMEEVWRRQEATVREVLEVLNRGRKQRAYTTIMTIMARLEKKRLLRRKKLGKTHVYRPAMSREEYMEARAHSEVEELVADYGDLALAQFARQIDGLDPERRQALRELAEEGS